jgi:hypothetical protein
MTKQVPSSEPVFDPLNFYFSLRGITVHDHQSCSSYQFFFLEGILLLLCLFILLNMNYIFRIYEYKIIFT